MSKLSTHGYSTRIYGDAATVATDLNTLTDARNIIQKMEVSMKTESTMKNVDAMLTNREEYIEVVAPAGMVSSKIMSHSHFFHAQLTNSI